MNSKPGSNAKESNRKGRRSKDQGKRRMAQRDGSHAVGGSQMNSKPGPNAEESNRKGRSKGDGSQQQDEGDVTGSTGIDAAGQWNGLGI